MSRCKNVFQLPIPHCPSGRLSEPVTQYSVRKLKTLVKVMIKTHKTKQVVFTLTVNTFCPLFQKACNCSGLLKPGSVQD